MYFDGWTQMGNGLYSIQMHLTRVSIPIPHIFKVFINRLEAIMESRFIKFTADLKLGNQSICLRAGLPFRKSRQNGKMELLCKKDLGWW